MSCSKPLVFIDYGFKPNGKRNLKVANMVKYGNLKRVQEIFGLENIVLAPCGKCPSCIKKYRRDWSLRCEAEARCHPVNCFVTLTYDDAHLVEKVSKQELRYFIKALRNDGIKIRYFGCGEYGSDQYNPVTMRKSTKRPHYHIVLFGYMPKDCKPIVKSDSGFWTFKSKYIESKWHKGLCTVQEFEPAVASYVAGYVDKKIDDKDCFIMMSTHPGIGHLYYRQHLDSLSIRDNFISKGGFVASLPRYFEKVADSAFYDLSDLKANRISKSQSMSLANCQTHGFENLEELFKYQGNIEERRKKHARNL